jgi:hypothetical protein
MFSRSRQQRFVEKGDPTRSQQVLAVVIDFQWWILLLVCVSAAAVHYFRPLPTPDAAMAKIQELAKTKAELEEKQKKIVRRIAWLQDTKSGYRELVAKDKLGWQAEDEVLLQIERTPAAPATR